MKLIERIKKLAARAAAEHDKGIRDFAKWRVTQNELGVELDSINKAAGPGLVVGRVLTFHVADGSATYVVTKVRKNDVVVEWVPLYDGYFSDAVGLSADKRCYVINRNTAEQRARYAESLSAMFA